MIRRLAFQWRIALAVGVALLAGLTLGVVGFRVGRPSPTSRTEAQASQAASPLTLLEAWDLFAAEGQRWRQGAEVVQLTSTNVNTDTATAGLDGRRASWLAILAAPDGKATLSLHSLGSTIDIRDQGPGVPGSKPLTKPQIDSPTAIANALAFKPDLRATEQKSRGYHFVLKEVAPGAISVMGSIQGTSVSIDVDARSGTVAGASAYTADATGGILYSADGGQTWQASSLTGQAVTSVTADPQQPRIAWATVAGQAAVSVYRTVDGGRTWAHASDLPSAAGPRAFGIAAGTEAGNSILAVGTAQGLWLSADGAKSWNKAGGLPAGPAQFLAFESPGNGLILHVTVSAGPNAAHYRSPDLQLWERAGNAGRLSQLDNHASIIAVEESTTPSATAPIAATLHQGTARTQLSLPAHVLRLAGDTTPGHPLLAESPDGIYRSTDGGRSWQKVLDASLASLGTGPGFANSGIGVAGGFRSGVYRTSDGGRTWRAVLRDPASLVPGNNEITAIVFTSDSDVVAVQGGTNSWKGLPK